MKYNIFFWHGFSQSVADKLDNLIHTVSTDGVNNRPDYFWNGTLDQFADEYDGNFVVLKYKPNPNEPTIETERTICVTQHTNFGQR